MGLFDGVKGLFKPKIIKEIYGSAWGCLVSEHGLTVDELSDHFRCVDKPDVKRGSTAKCLRIFSLRDIERKGVTVIGWETFDQHPDLILFEGYLDENNQSHLERKNGRK